MRSRSGVLATLVCAVVTSGGVQALPHAEADVAPVLTISSSVPQLERPASTGDPWGSISLSGTYDDGSGADYRLQQTLTITDADADGPLTSFEPRTVVTDSTGAWQLRGVYPANHDGGPGMATQTFTVSGPGGLSASVVVPVPADLTRVLPGETHPPAGAPFVATGAVEGPTGTTVTGEVPDGAGGWRAVSTGRSDFAFSYQLLPGYRHVAVPFPTPRRGPLVYRLSFAGDARHGPAVSRTFSVPFGPSRPAGSRRSYALADDSRGKPVRFDPCRPVTWALNAKGAPPGAKALVAEAVRRVATATGGTFRFVGLSTARPSKRESQGRFATGRGPMILVKWVGSRESDIQAEADRDVWGRAYVIEGTDGRGREHPGGGTVLLYRSAQLSPDTSADGWLPVLLHEFGHVMGLQHVADPTQVMFPQDVGTTAYGAGDVAGLRRLGKGSGCGTS
ncbi:matrixin family metalloprotease [Motilibacter rhizosphaerae]|uniref:matrixin family metalloprotease n=1 Tax=Motilibacter rhizosphaerae TaxID=598652 RepID=UPI00102BD1E7|nr:matrixin family metalloprotease [Motilibacter rhizosphaerae]